MKPYFYATNLNGVAITIFTRYIVLIEPSPRHPGTLIRMSESGTVFIDVKESYEGIMSRVCGDAAAWAMEETGK